MSDIMTVVVAMTFVRDARSNGVFRVTAAPASNVRGPKASLQWTPALSPTSTVAAGKTRALMASRMTRAASFARVEVAALLTTTRHPSYDHAEQGARQHVPRPGQRREETH